MHDRRTRKTSTIVLSQCSTPRHSSMVGNWRFETDDNLGHCLISKYFKDLRLSRTGGNSFKSEKSHRFSCSREYRYYKSTLFLDTTPLHFFSLCSLMDGSMGRESTSCPYSEISSFVRRGSCLGISPCSFGHSLIKRAPLDRGTQHESNPILPTPTFVQTLEALKIQWLK